MAVGRQGGEAEFLSIEHLTIHAVIEESPQSSRSPRVSTVPAIHTKYIFLRLIYGIQEVSVQGVLDGRPTERLYAQKSRMQQWQIYHYEDHPLDGRRSHYW